MEKVDLQALYQFDEIYRISSEQSEQSERVEDKSEGLEIQVTGSETTGKNENESSNKSEVLEIQVTDGETIGIKTEWLIIGEEADRKSVLAIFTSAPFSFPEEKFTFQPAEGWSIEQMRDFVKKSTSSKMVFLGQAFEFLKLKPEPIEKANRFFYYFPKTLNSLTDSDKQLKIQFWNNLKKML